MSTENTTRAFETKAVHAGQEFDQWSNSELVPPIVTSITYYQKNPTNIFDVSTKTSQTLKKYFHNKLGSFSGLLLWP